MPIDEKTNLMTGAQILLECLKKEGVNEVFGYPGGAILDYTMLCITALI